MSSSPHGRGDEATGSAPGAPVPEPEQDRDGGDPVCWAFMVCEECGAVVSEGHRAGCSVADQPASPLRAFPG
jgi:hypothetical protein